MRTGFRAVVVTLAITGSLVLGGAAPAEGALQLGACVVPLGTSCGTLTIVPVPAPGLTSGDGRVTSSPAGIDCTIHGASTSGTCTKAFTWPGGDAGSGFYVELSVAPAQGSNALGPPPYLQTPWPDVLPLEEKLHNYEDRTTTIQIVLERRTLTVSRSGVGTGKVTSSPGGINCGATCDAYFDYGSRVTLSAVPDAGAVFKSWTGVCAGQGRDCSLKLNDPDRSHVTTTNAVFDVPSTQPPAPVPPPVAPPPTPAPQPLDTVVDADLIAATSGHSTLGARVVRSELDLAEDVSATLTLTRSGKTLSTKQLARLRQGTRVVTLVVPRRVSAGKATLLIELRDLSGNTRSWQRSVRIPRIKR